MLYITTALIVHCQSRPKLDKSRILVHANFKTLWFVHDQEIFRTPHLSHGPNETINTTHLSIEGNDLRQFYSVMLLSIKVISFNFAEMEG